MKAPVIHLYDDTATVVFGRAGDVLTETVPIDRGDSAPAIERLVALMDEHGVRGSATLVLHLTVVHVRRIDGLPATGDPRTLRSVMAATPFRYFLRSTDEPVITDLLVESPGVAIAALVDGVMLRAIVQAIQEHGLPVKRVVVRSEAMNADLEVPRNEWCVRDRASRWRPSAYGVGIAVACVVLAIAIPARDAVLARRAERALARTRVPARRAVELGAELQRLREPLERLRQARSKYPSGFRLLDAISWRLPPEGRLLEFENDSSEVRVVAAVPDLPRFVRRLERMPGTSGVALRGSIMRDSASGQVLERAELVFRALPASAGVGRRE